MRHEPYPPSEQGILMGDSSLSIRCKPPYSLQHRACPPRSALIHIFFHWLKKKKKDKTRKKERRKGGEKAHRGRQAEGKWLISPLIRMDVGSCRGFGNKVHVARERKVCFLFVVTEESEGWDGGAGRSDWWEEDTQRGQHTLSVVTVHVITGRREADKLRRTTWGHYYCTDLLLMIEEDCF